MTDPNPLVAADCRFVTLPACPDHRGVLAIDVVLPWTCPACGGPRGEPWVTTFDELTHPLTAHTWLNPCQHFDYLHEVREEVAQRGRLVRHVGVPRGADAIASGRAPTAEELAAPSEVSTHDRIARLGASLGLHGAVTLADESRLRRAALGSCHGLGSSDAEALEELWGELRVRAAMTPAEVASLQARATEALTFLASEMARLARHEARWQQLRAELAVQARLARALEPGGPSTPRAAKAAP